LPKFICILSDHEYIHTKLYSIILTGIYQISISMKTTGSRALEQNFSQRCLLSVAGDRNSKYSCRLYVGLSSSWLQIFFTTTKCIVL